MAHSAAPLSIGTQTAAIHERTQDTQCFQTADTENVQLRTFTQSHGNIEKVHSHMQTDIFWSDRHRKASSLTHTQYTDVCRCGKTCDTHTNTSMQTHSDLYTRWRLAHSTTADFILNVTPPSWLELTIIFGLNEFVVLLICRFPTRSLKTHRASN